MMKLTGKWWIAVPVVCGLALLMVMKNTRKAPERLGHRERVRTVRVIALEPQDVRPRARGFGFVAADKSWDAVAEVSGKVVHMAPDLKKGRFVKKGELLCRLDPESYGLAESRDQADVHNLEAQLAELEQSRENTERILAVERRSLEISTRELERNQALFKEQIISATDLETQERQLLTQQSRVRELENTLELIPARKKALLARKTAGLSQVKTRQLDLGKTEFRAPFDGRVSLVNIEQGQFVPAARQLLQVHSIEQAEIGVPMIPEQLMALIPGRERLPRSISSTRALDQALDISATVSYALDLENRITWPARFSRTADALDETTGALQVYVRVDQPYGRVVPGKRPPLASGMYVAVEFMGAVVKNQWVVPRTALHPSEDQGPVIFLCDAEDRLVQLPVSVAFLAGELAVLAPQGALESGVRLVLSDLMPAVSGMKLKPVADPTSADWLRAQALGGTDHGQ